MTQVNEDRWTELHNAKHNYEQSLNELNAKKEAYQEELIAGSVGEILSEEGLSRRELTLILESLVNKVRGMYK